ncbi:MAG TPA: ATP-binding protein, partial [Vicinamibacteria bacterium]
HRIDVRAIDRNWNVDPTPATREFVVLLPWYRESGFLLVGALGSLALLLAVGSFVWRHVRLERLVGERTMALGEANTLLRAQLADRTRIEEQRARLEGQLHQAQKLEAVGRLAGGIAHDFNNLLTVITGFAELARDDATTSPSARACIDEIAKAADRASALTRQVLAFSRQQVVLPASLDVNTVVADIERMLHRLIGEDIALSFQPGPGLWPVLADRGQLEQVMVNLAVNARDAMPDGGQLTIATANVELDEAFTRAHAGTRPGPHVLLTVADTGTGMDAETRARIFEPFFTTKARDKGTGLGLATVYGIMKQSDGHIEIDTAPGQGTTFRLYFPRVDEPAEPVADGEAEPMRVGPETILLVEDGEALRQLVASMLRDRGHTVLEADCGRAALEIADRHPGVIELLLTDVVMPGITGRQVAREVALRQPAIRVVYMSGHSDETLGARGILDPGTTLLEKPFTGRDLDRCLWAALGDAPKAHPAGPVRAA